MHLQEVFRAIYANHHYEYFVIGQNFKIIEYSDRVSNYCDIKKSSYSNIEIFEVLPELFGMQEQLQILLDAKSEPLLLPYIFKEPDSYINIRIHQGRHTETLIVLLENVTKMAAMEQSLVQDRNEKSLLLDEIAEKNLQLQTYNNHMQELVAQETRKNSEKQKMLELQSRHSQMGEIIGMITHQWKQPLGIINISCALIKMAQQKKKLNETLLMKHLGDITNQVKYMDTTVSDFQQFFNPSKEKHFFNLKQTITKIITLVRNDYELCNISLEVYGDDDVTVEGHSNEYNQVVLSILKNAKDVFTEHPHDAMCIRIEVGRSHERSLVRITDNAGGIPDDIIESIFDLYMTTKKEGSGLGLNIAKNVIENNMNGKLEVKNSINGAEFSIIL
ncbi:MAG: HAMP domain-containing sensor histidine kinase [Campylobacterota bacterium]|nr:HAMP domain-containing sensor histidine kinase [Campylobacterota bacterium]